MAEEPILRQHLVVFLDVLGFSDAIEAAYQGGDPQQQFAHFRSIALSGLERLRSIGKQWDVRLFTDNILLAAPTYGDRAPEEFASMYEAVSRYQLDLAREGYFVRGGAEIGDYWSEPDLIYGKAILDAVRLEKAANAPRVVLGKQAARAAGRNRDVSALRIGTDMESIPDDEPRFRPVRREGDTFFIDYLIAAYDHHGGPQLPVFERHRDLITARLEEFASHPKIKRKYAWLQMYHNRHCVESQLPPRFLIA